jgi:hypothetical protein
MTMKLIFSGLLLLAFSVGTLGLSKLRPEIMGIGLGTNRDAARARLESIGSLEKEDRKLQQVWAIRDQRISHLLIGFDAESRVRYVTAIARSGGPRIRYAEIADVNSAQRMQTQGNYRFTWEVAEREGHPGYVIIAHGHDPQYLDSYSVKMISEKEVD